MTTTDQIPANASAARPTESQQAARYLAEAVQASRMASHALAMAHSYLDAAAFKGDAGASLILAKIAKVRPTAGRINATLDKAFDRFMDAK
jgi:hypothetical protein